ncbi:hypothetical protein B0T17DRAFT_612462 [Bombardia bombarda]|uniref:Uncharacterized protein n=1 Tax=Bombardia bombarda TaxID=252184 RepID=A0AA40CET7_9PEZI|nr:hypothetical protein B0T17DRAFT_612462 [Bombardia bombarda]
MTSRIKPTRSMFIHVNPVPTGLAQRRAILGALKQHGDIQVFKQLDDPSTFVSVASTHMSADATIRMSPLQFDYAPTTTTFTLSIFRAKPYLHKQVIDSSPLHGPWPAPAAPPSIATAALRAAIPKSMASRCLADWETGNEQLVRSVKGQTVDDHVKLREQRRRHRIDSVAAPLVGAEVDLPDDYVQRRGASRRRVDATTGKHRSTVSKSNWGSH